MKIAITGHTKGLGLEFAKCLELRGHQIQGFSRSNGYDLRNWAKMQKMLSEIADFDMLISCAKPDYVQTVLLYEAFKAWKGLPKTILNISSILTYYTAMPAELSSDVMMHFYKNTKNSLNQACVELSTLSAEPKIMLVKPGHLYSQQITEAEQARLTAWVNFLLDSIEQAQTLGFTIKEITLE